MYGGWVDREAGTHDIQDNLDSSSIELFFGHDRDEHERDEHDRESSWG